MAEGEAIDGDNEHEHHPNSDAEDSDAGDAGDSPESGESGESGGGGQIASRLIALREMLIKAGLIVELQRDDGDWFLVCAAQRGPDGLYGNSIRLAFREERPLVSTLADRSYAVPDGANLAQLCRDCVDSSESTMDRLPDDVVERHRLEIVAEA